MILRFAKRTLFILLIMLGRQPIIPNEHQCWQSFLRGNEDSFTYFHQLYYNDLYFYGLKVVSDEDQVKNAIQELFLQLWKNRQSLNPVHSVKHYLLSAFRRHLYRLLDKEKQQKKFAQTIEANRFAFSAEDIIVQRETEMLTRSLLVRALNQLPPRQREIVYLRYTSGLTHEEIATLLSINYQSVVNMLARAISTLRVRMVAEPSEKGVALSSA